MKRILITGAGGFIGRNLIEQLSEEYEILPVSHQTVDLLEQKQVERLFQKENIDVVIHSATQGTLGKGKAYEDMMLKNNLQMFLNLERCHSAYGKMFVLGSGAEYDKRQELSLVGEEEFGKSIPVDNYGLSKYLISKIILQSDNIYNLRLFGIFGKYENYNYRFISNIICKALLGEDISIHQNVLFDYLYIKDFCKIMSCFIRQEQNFKCYNVCTGRKYDIVWIAKEILRQTENNSSFKVEKTGWNKEYTGDNRKMLMEIGIVEFTPMEQAIAELIDYYKKIDFHLEGNY